jgi:hypothetical protein
MKIIRVFPKKTNLTPDDEDVRINVTPFFFDDADEIHISVLFDNDLDRADWLAKQWEKVAPVRIGGPATGERGENFVPGMYVKKGAVITSRGCPNNCWFCSVPKREGNKIRELPITEGWNILDDNLLRCSENHIRNVFEMLKQQNKPAKFSGGFEAAALQDWHIQLLESIKIDQMFFAYDTPNDYEPLVIASKKFKETRFDRHHLRVYCLIGYPNDTLEKAEKRLADCVKLNFFPMAMLYRNKNYKNSEDWKRLQYECVKPNIVYAKFKQIKEQGH